MSRVTRRIFSILLESSSLALSEVISGGGVVYRIDTASVPTRCRPLRNKLIANSVSK